MTPTGGRTRAVRTHGEIVADPALLDAVVDQVLLPSFSTDEIWDRDTTRDLVVAGALTATALVEDGIVLGASAEERGGPGEVGLLSYLASRPGSRSRGVGGELLDHLVADWARGPAALVVGEVHDPRLWPEADDERPAARLRFYARHGARLLDLPWVQPALTPGRAPVPGMLLITLHPLGGTHVESAPVRRWIEAYTGDEPAPEVEPVLRRLGRRPTLETLDVDDLARIKPLPSP
ncbi:MAG TPA: hypothetical protein VEW93_13970 [Acidimicrobiales bacterium]|nr:hypothetical protein [Acidimicrobiales bacterium]